MADADGLDKDKIKRYLVPGGAVIAIVVLVGLVIYASGGSGRKMSDGSDGTSGDSALKDLAPGVRYRDLKEGTGDPVLPGAEVKIHYTGWLENGTVFDSSKEGKANPQPVTFKLEGLIKGWQDGIPGMKPGGIRKLVISPEKGYGERGTPKIPANSTLIFEVELVEAVPPRPERDMTKLTDGTAPGADDPKLITIEGGLKYRDLKEGTGEPVAEGANVIMHYTGWLTNGRLFDSSWLRDKPFDATLRPGSRNSVIEGWNKGIPGMKPGGIRKLVIPPEMAYGPAGQGDIPPNSTLVFEVELIK